MTSVHACIQQIPDPDKGQGELLEIRDLEAHADTYLEAVAKVEATVPDGWRVLYVSSEESQAQDSSNSEGEKAEPKPPGPPARS